MIRQMAIAIALLGFKDLGSSVTSTFLFIADFIYNNLHIVQNEQKINVGRCKKVKYAVHGTWYPAILRL